MTNQSVISLAILKVNWDNLKKDYLENFVPIVSEAIRSSSRDEVSIPNLQSSLKTLFGLQIPQNAIRAILRRLQKRGYIRQQNRIYFRDSDALLKLKFHEVQQQVLRMHENLITHLQRFAQERFEITLTEDAAENAFQEYIQENQIAIANFSEDQETIIPAPEVKIKGAKYMVGAFIRHLEESQSPDFEYLETIMKGNLIANAIFITDPSTTSKKFKRTEVYFDTSFLIYAVGYAGKVRQDPCLELLDLLRKDGARLRCFRHTLEEARGVLEACAQIIRRGNIREGYGPSIEYFITNKFTASDIEMFIVNFDRDLENLRIHVAERPPYVPEYVIDEAKLLTLLTEKIQYHNIFAPQRDVDSISAIMRLRSGGEFYFVEESKAVFVTTNNSLVRLSRDFFYQESPIGTIPPAIPDYLLTNLLWLKSPFSAPDLPRKRIIADYYAATQPSNHTWNSYLDEINKLEENQQISTNDYYLLRYALEAKSALMDVTLGEEQIFSFVTINEILSLTRKSIQQEKEDDLQNKINAEIAMRRSAEDIASSALAREMNRKARIATLARRTSFTIILSAKILTVSLLIIGTISTFPWDLPAFKMKPFNYIISVLQVIFLILSIGSLMYGTALETYFNRLDIWLAKMVEKSLDRIFG